jgi:serine/threonine-protein kinase PpkA
MPTIPGFVLTELLGRGGMASVYAATQTALDRYVAIKVVSAEGPDAAQYLHRLENEARSLAGLHHPNIVDLYEFGRTEQGALYYVMPLLNGGDLTRWAKPLPEDRLVALLDTLLDALGHAHDADIVHRDIKPENILFDDGQRPMLADFGVALRRASQRVTADGMAVGSTGYMSPEQARGIEVDARSDLYSVGVLAFELLTGELPYDGPDALAVALAQCEQPVPRLLAGLAHWQAFFDRALAFEPQDRFASALEMRLALHALHRPRLPRTPLRWYHVAAIALIALPLVASLWLARDPPADGERIAALVEANALLPPADPNALDQLLQAQARRPGDRELRALQAQLLDLLAMEMGPAIQQGDLVALQPQWTRWREAVARLDAAHSEVVLAHQRPVEELLRQTLAQAAGEFDRALALPALELLEGWPGANEDLQRLAAQVRRLPLQGERFSDPDGPDLLLVRRPNGRQPGLAVMADALQPALYRRFAEATRRSRPPCPGAAESLQGCVDLADAQALAGWLSTRSGERYRVPSRQELASVIAHVEPVAAHAWTSTCHEVTTTQAPNPAQRAWGGVRSVFGGQRAEPRVEQRCDGHLALPLDGQGRIARTFREASAQTTVVLLREVRASLR